MFLTTPTYERVTELHLGAIHFEKRHILGRAGTAVERAAAPADAAVVPAEVYVQAEARSGSDVPTAPADAAVVPTEADARAEPGGGN